MELGEERFELGEIGLRVRDALLIFAFFVSQECLLLKDEVIKDFNL